MKKSFLSILLLLLYANLMADHITGGMMWYSYGNAANGSITYAMTLKLYMRCNSGRQFNNPTIISVFGKKTNTRILDQDVQLSRRETISLTNPDPCISNPPPVCYDVGYYDFTLTLPQSADGYIVAGQVNFRISGISNLENGYSQIGATYTAEIPGIANGADAIKNNSAVFTGNDLVVVCANTPFTYSFAANDRDNDEVLYTFCEAYRSTNNGGGPGSTATPPGPPPYNPIPYGNGFNGQSPLGPNVTIDTHTGLISGVAPAAGVYVVTVCAEEYRGGKLIAIQRKDLQIAITNCSLTAAKLPEEFQLCKDTKTITFSNQSISTLVNDYTWEVRDNPGKLLFTSKLPSPSYEFPDTGIYTVKLVINRKQRCTDSATAPVLVYPGFKPNFDYFGICFNKPTLFTDRTTTVYGRVNYWHWNFGDPGPPTADTSLINNISYTFKNRGLHNVEFIAYNANGCKDTIYKIVEIYDKPPIRLNFKDTLICPPDALQIKAQDPGNYTWTGGTGTIRNFNTESPTVAPLTTTTYYVKFEIDGCINNDSVLVRVTPNVTLKVMEDTTICTGDRVTLNLTSNAVNYRWTPSALLNDATLASPTALTVKPTTYTVTGSISSCTATGSVLVTTVDYPVVNAGADTVICFNASARLHGSTNGSVYSWTPSNSLDNSSILSPLSTPPGTTQYTLSVVGNKGCPKPAVATVKVTVLPKIDAGSSGDTVAVVGQDLQLKASGGTSYQWEPSIGLSSTSIANPIAFYYEGIDEILYKVLVSNAAGCTDSVLLKVKVFSTRPTVFVPTGFTPNGDGKNDLLRPIAAGIKSIERFVVFNRYGQQIFKTTVNGHGWDGRINGQLQQTGTYVWMVQATDYLGKQYVQKGTATLIR